MKKIMLIMFCMVLLVGSVSAFKITELNDRLTYSNDDLKISLDNWWGLGKTIGTAELKSHKTEDKIRNVIEEKDRVDMYYDFNFSEEYVDGLGQVTFSDLRTGEELNKGYYFAQAVYEEYRVPKYNEVCVDGRKLGNGTILQECSKTQIDDYVQNRIERWDRLDNNNTIPYGEVTIGLVTNIISKE